MPSRWDRACACTSNLIAGTGSTIELRMLVYHEAGSLGQRAIMAEMVMIGGRNDIVVICRSMRSHG